MHAVKKKEVGILYGRETISLAVKPGNQVYVSGHCL
jgi:hypothetical protein